MALGRQNFGAESVLRIRRFVDLMSVCEFPEYATICESSTPPFRTTSMHQLHRSKLVRGRRDRRNVSRLPLLLVASLSILHGGCGSEHSDEVELEDGSSSSHATTDSSDELNDSSSSTDIETKTNTESTDNDNGDDDHGDDFIVGSHDACCLDWQTENDFLPFGDEPFLEDHLSPAEELVVRDDVLFAHTPESGLIAVRLSDSREMELLGRYAQPGHAIRVQPYKRNLLIWYREHPAYKVAEEAPHTVYPVRTDRLVLVDADDPRKMRERNFVRTPGYILGTHIVGDTLIVASIDYSERDTSNIEEHALWLRTYDLREPAVLELRDEVQLPEAQGSPFAFAGVKFNENGAYLVHRTSGSGTGTDAAETTLYTYFVNSNAKLIAAQPITLAGDVGPSWHMDIYNGYLRLLAFQQQPDNSYLGSVVVLRLNSAKEPLVVGRYDDSTPIDFSGGMQFSEDRLYFYARGNIQIFDLTVPESPRSGGFIPFSGLANDWSAQGNRLVTGEELDELASANRPYTVKLYSTQDAQAPVELASVQLKLDEHVSSPNGYDRLSKSFLADWSSERIFVPGTIVRDANVDDDDEDNDYQWRQSALATIDMTQDTLRDSYIAVGNEAFSNEPWLRRGIAGTNDNLVMSSRSIYRAPLASQLDITTQPAQPTIFATTQKLDYAQRMADSVLVGARLVAVNASPDNHLQVSVYANLDEAAQGRIAGQVVIDRDELAKTHDMAVPEFKLYAGEKRAYLYIDRRRVDWDRPWALLSIDASNPAMPTVVEVEAGRELDRSHASPPPDDAVSPALMMDAQDTIYVGEHLFHTWNTFHGAVPESVNLFGATSLRDPDEPLPLGEVKCPPKDSCDRLYKTNGHVYTWHFEEVPGHFAQRRYYYDELSLGTDQTLQFGPAISVPGVVVARESGDIAWVLAPPASDSTSVAMSIVRVQLPSSGKATIINEFPLEPGLIVRQVTTSDKRLFVHAKKNVEDGDDQVLVFPIDAGAAAAPTRVKLATGARLISSDDHGVVYQVWNRLGLIDATNINAIEHKETDALPFFHFCGRASWDDLAVTCLTTPAGAWRLDWTRSVER